MTNPRARSWAKSLMLALAFVPFYAQAHAQTTLSQEGKITYLQLNVTDTNLQIEPGGDDNQSFAIYGARDRSGVINVWGGYGTDEGSGITFYGNRYRGNTPRVPGPMCQLQDPDKKAIVDGKEVIEEVGEFTNRYEYASDIKLRSGRQRRLHYIACRQEWDFRSTALTNIGNLRLSHNMENRWQDAAPLPEWNRAYNVLEGNNLSIAGHDVDDKIMLGTNFYYDSSGRYRYKNDGISALYESNNGSHVFKGAESGGAGADIAFVEQLRINADGSIKIATDNDNIDHANANLYSGFFRPALLWGPNVKSATPEDAQYTRVGDVVTVSGRVKIEAEEGNKSTWLNMMLPVPSSLGAAAHCAGTAVQNAPNATHPSLSAAIYGIGSTARLKYISNDVSETSFYYSYTYRVISN